jgi:mannose-6-phosphate isomerase
MNVPPLPVVFEPLFKPKPWGGQQLARLLNKRPPAETRIGESWELVSLPGNESRVCDGPLAGRTLTALVQLWGRDLLGDAPLVAGRFPLLIKFLDAYENLSVQVHPKPDGTGGPRGVKHEAWYVIHADPGAKLFIGLKPGVGPADVARAANAPDMVHLLREWSPQPGQCYCLPSGTLHALGAGLVVAEIQTPSDVTYRAYDWNRVDAAGRPRALHVAQALRNIRYDVTEAMISQPATEADAALIPRSRLTRVACGERFTLDVLPLRGGQSYALTGSTMRVWIILSGAVRFTHEACQPPLTTDCSPGDVVLIPARCAGLRIDPPTDCRCLEVTIPGRPP